VEGMVRKNVSDAVWGQPQQNCSLYFCSNTYSHVCCDRHFMYGCASRSDLLATARALTADSCDWVVCSAVHVACYLSFTF
jgi:hypothetical protein